MIPAEQIVDTDTKVKFFEKLSFGLCVLAGACGGAAISRLICELSLVDVIHYDLYFRGCCKTSKKVSNSLFLLFELNIGGIISQIVSKVV